MNILLKVLLTFLTPVSAHTDIRTFESSPVLIQWEDYGENYEYRIELYDDISDNTILSSNWFDTNSLEVPLWKESLYLWNLYIREKGMDCFDDHQCLEIESGYFYFDPTSSEDIDDNYYNEDVFPTVDEIEENEEIGNVQEKEEIIEDIVLGTSIKRIDNQKDEEQTEKTKKENEVKEDVILEKNSCIYKYNIKKENFYLENCNIKKPQINSSTYYKSNSQYVVNTSGSYQNLVDIKINTVTCKNFDLFDPKTWFNCKEVFIRSDTYKNIKLQYGAFFLTSKTVSPSNFIFKDTEFEMSTEVQNIPENILIKGGFSVEHNNHWLDQEMNIVLPVEFKEAKISNNGRYSFPFNKIVYVNQWHGCTDYQCPHKGIDFAAVKENIYASDNGIVVSKGYDNYSGECNSGGNYLVVKYDGGHHMAYLHLEKSYVNVNQKINKGDLIALSGNSGSHNCQPLGYHLHFELRQKRSQSTHIDPVPFININWNLVKTNKSNIYPKRLSGDNPHPNF